MVVKAGRKVPSWLNAEFIFNLNYGPMSAQDIRKIRAMFTENLTMMLKREFPALAVKQKLDYVEERTEMTLLDRPIAAKLHKSLYNRGPCFETDWSSDGEPDESTGRLSPFDYDRSTEQTFPMLWAEKFIITTVWAKHYSSSIIGSATKPPMAAVVLDMIDLIEFLKPIKERKTIIEWLTEFVRNNQLRSILPDRGIDVDWAGRGYIADLFSVVACLECTSFGPPPFSAGLDVHQDFKFPQPYTATIPGSGVLIQTPNPVSEAASDGDNSVDQLSASFIHSGPFKLRVTRKLAEHLTFDRDSTDFRVFQYWGNHMTPGEGLGYTSSLRVYRNHTLRRYPTIYIH
jgi:hypothetical protein